MAFNTGITILPGYPLQVGDKMLAIFDRTGPTSYTQYSTSTLLGGDILFANTGGMAFGGFDRIISSLDTTGQITCNTITTLGGYGNAVPQVTFKYVSNVTASLGGQSQTAGNEIAASTNLSTFSFRIEAYMV
jgi:hypothetical protein